MHGTALISLITNILRRTCQPDIRQPASSSIRCVPKVQTCYSNEQIPRCPHSTAYKQQLPARTATAALQGVLVARCLVALIQQVLSRQVPLQVLLHKECDRLNLELLRPVCSSSSRHGQG